MLQARARKKGPKVFQKPELASGYFCYKIPSLHKIMDVRRYSI